MSEQDGLDELTAGMQLFKDYHLQDFQDLKHGQIEIYSSGLRRELEFIKQYWQIICTKMGDRVPSNIMDIDAEKESLDIQKNLYTIKHDLIALAFRDLVHLAQNDSPQGALQHIESLMTEKEIGFISVVDLLNYGLELKKAESKVSTTLK